jgi:hypothetical protein
MLTKTSHRLAVMSVALGAVVPCVAVGSAAVGAAPRHPAAPARSKITSSSLTAVSVAPHSTTAFAYGTQSTVRSSSTYALRRRGTHWSKVGVKVPKNGTIYGVATGSPRSAWLVGDVLKGTTVGVLVEHSHGGAFKPVSTGLGRGQLLAAAASSPTNVWAVGDGLLTQTPLIVHSTGKKWKPLRDTKQVGYNYSAVSTSGPKNVWLLGDSTTGVVAAVWNGHKLRTMSIPVPSGASVNHIATTSAHNTWVSGSTVVGTKVQHERVFTEHWNGHKWTVVKTPAIGYGTLQSSLSAAGSHAYIAGYSYPKAGLTDSVLIMRFNAGRWRVAAAASPGRMSTLGSISVSTKGGAAVGAWSLRGVCGVAHPTPFKPLVENLSGSSWHQAAAPNFRVGATRVVLSPSRPDVPSC